MRIHGPSSARRRLSVLIPALALACGALAATGPADAAPSAGTAATAATASAKRVDNGRIAFVRGGKIYTVNSAGGDQRLLTPRTGNQRPHYSPDGTRIAYIHHTRHVGWNVWVMNADGTDKQQVTHRKNVTEAQWSPNGKWLVFGPTLSKVSSTAPFGEPVPLLGDLGSGPEELQVDRSLDWSPAGGLIAYYSHQYPDSPDNYLLVLDIAAQQVNLVWEVGGSCCGEGYFGNPAWSPDGSQLAYEQMIYVPENGEHPTRPEIEIDEYPSRANSGYPMTLGDKDPEFAPNGNKLLFSHVEKGVLSIMTADIDGSNRQLVQYGSQPDWQPVPDQTRH